MNLREQFEKERGWHPSTVYDRMESRYKMEYIEWLEQRNKEQVEVLERAYEEIKALAINKGLTENEFNSVVILVDIKEQLEKSGEL